MPRNLDRRVEVLIPVREKGLRDMLTTEVLEVHLTDNSKARRLLPDGTYKRISPAQGELSIDSQKIMMSRSTGWNPPERGEET